MVAVRLSPRVDPSDVVQEALAAASELLPGYLQKQLIPFYPWLRRLAWERLVKLHRTHIAAEKRTVAREVVLELPDGSVNVLAQLDLAPNTSPSNQAVRKELQALVRAALNKLGERDREVLILRSLEQLSTGGGTRCRPASWSWPCFRRHSLSTGTTPCRRTCRGVGGWRWRPGACTGPGILSTCSGPPNGGLAYTTVNLVSTVLGECQLPEHAKAP
jgi:RNA polymerase sigma factor (sigma-70 family)